MKSYLFHRPTKRSTIQRAKLENLDSVKRSSHEHWLISAHSRKRAEEIANLWPTMPSRGTDYTITAHHRCSD